MIETLKSRNFESEFVFSTSRSGGPGGQHVNKTETKVELRFNIPCSDLLSPEEKAKLFLKLSSKISQEGELIITSSQTRSQLTNKEICIEKFYTWIADALKPIKKRRPTRMSRKAKEKRLTNKKKLSDKKTQRKKPGEE
jgi:ribosome-associated protein